MPSLPSPAFFFAAQLPGVKYQAAASTPIVATLNNLASVSNVSWRVITVDDLTFTALSGDLTAYALTLSGPKNSVCTLTSAPAGTAGFLEATVNGGVNPLTGNIDPVMSTHVKWWVPAANGAEVICFNEQLESGDQGWLPLINGAIRDAGGGGGTVTSVSGTAPIVSSGGATPAISISAASGGAAGSMSAANFTKLGSLVVPTDVAVTTTQVAVNGSRMRVDSSGGPITVTVSVSSGFECWLRVVGAANTITISPSSGTIQQLDGSFAATLTTVTTETFFFRGNGTAVEIWSHTHLT